MAVMIPCCLPTEVADYSRYLVVVLVASNSEHNHHTPSEHPKYYKNKDFASIIDMKNRINKYYTQQTVKKASTTKLLSFFTYIKWLEFEFWRKRCARMLKTCNSIKGQ